MRTKKQISVALLLVFLAIMLSIIFEFSLTINNVISGFFVLLGCWFSYTNYKKKNN